MNRPSPLLTALSVPYIIAMNTPRKQSKHTPLIKYTRNILRKVNTAVNEFGLIADGDRVCVALSGGKDSLSLLHLLIEHSRFFPFRYEIAAAFVRSDADPRADETEAYLTGICRDRGIPFEILPITVALDEHGEKKAPTCFWCSWNRRQALFDHCIERGYTRLALGHHSDDVAETTLMNLLYHGNLETMLPRRAFFDGRFDLIRPLFYVREKDTAQIARLAGFDAHTCTCGLADESKRRVMKDAVRALKKDAKYLHQNLWKASRVWWETFGDRPLHPEPRK
jgi:tRNA 2-thiocytidine biosynthesis protein TtcA